MKLVQTIAVVIFVALAAPLAHADSVRTVALSGDAAPGTAAGVNYRYFDPPQLNDSGQTSFLGTLTGTGVDHSNDEGIWSEGGGSGLQKVARTGEPAPGTEAGVNYDRWSNPILNDSGQTSFWGVLTGTGIDNSNTVGIWSEGGGNGLQKVVRAGEPAPGTEDGVNYRAFSLPLLNDSGETAFRGFLIGTGVDGSNDQGIWSEGGRSGFQKIARTGEPAPGTEAGVNYRFIGRPVLNDRGQTAFHGFLTGTGVDHSNDEGIWSEGGGSGLQKVVRAGEPAPGTEAGVNFERLGNTELNDSGQTAFLGTLTGTGVDNSNAVGIWSEGGGSGLQKVARAGEPAIGTEAGVNYKNFEPPVLNDSGKTAFRGFLIGTGVDGSNDHVIWSEGGGSGLQKVARTGEPAPGTEAGVNFSDFEKLVLNDSGQTAFLGKLTGTGVDGTNDRGIWVEDLLGSPTLIVRTGDQLDVDDGSIMDLRTVSHLSFLGGFGNGFRISGLNDLGQLAFGARFTDGTTGIFVSGAIAVPEPSTVLLGLVVGAGFLSRRRRSRQSA